MEIDSRAWAKSSSVSVWRNAMSNKADFTVTVALNYAAKLLRHLEGIDFRPIYNSGLKLANLRKFAELGFPEISDDGVVVEGKVLRGVDLAKTILGPRFISPQDIAQAFGQTYSPEQLAHLYASMPDFDTLLKLFKSECVLLPTLPRGDKVKDLGNYTYFQEPFGIRDDELRDQFLALSESFSEVRWIVLCGTSMMRPISWSTGDESLSSKERLPTAFELIYVALACKRIRAEYGLLNGLRDFVRTTSVTEKGALLFSLDNGQNPCLTYQSQDDQLSLSTHFICLI